MALTAISAALALLAFGAAPASPSAGQDAPRIIVELRLNGHLEGDAFVIRADGRLWLRHSRLTGLGVTRAGGEHRDFNGETYVALDSLAPNVTFVLDEEKLELRLTATAEMFEPSRVVLQNSRPAGIEYSRGTGMYLNYGASYVYGQGAAQPSSSTATLEAGLSIKGSLASTSYTRTPEGNVIRGISSLTIDVTGPMIRTVVGDTFGRASLLGSLPTVGGASFQRDVDLDPYRVLYPLPEVTGSVSTQSNADVYVNGVIVRRVRLTPGQFDLTRLPVSGGLGTVKVVVRDSLGREQTFGGPYYFTSSVLSQGSHDFQYLVGARRTDQTDANPTYGTLVGTAQHRVGVTDWLTLGGRVEGTRDVVSGGPVMNARVSRLGEVQIEVAVSEAQHRVDYAFAGTYGFTSRWVTASFTTQLIGPHFANLDLLPTDARNPTRTNATVGTTLGRVTINLFYSNQTTTDVSETEQAAPLSDSGSSPRVVGGPSPASVSAERRAGATTYLQLGKRTQLVFSGARVNSENAPRGWTAVAGVSVLLGPHSVAAVTVNQPGDGTVRTSVNAQRSLPLGSGIGYRVSGGVTDTDQWTGLAQFQAQGRRGLITLQDSVSQGQSTATAEIAGSIVAAGGRVTLGRTVNDGYAVIRVTDNPGVRVYVNNQLAGRTGQGGAIVVPGLLPYYANSVSIAPEDIGLEYQIDRVHAVVAPPNRGPAVVTFGAVVFRGISGKVVVLDGDTRVIPAYGDMTFERPGHAAATSPIGANGEFYLENVPEGSLDLSVAFGERVCRFTVNVPQGIRIAVDVGEVVCVMGK
jgi:outer membrane usher protein